MAVPDGYTVIGRCVRAAGVYTVRAAAVVVWWLWDTLTWPVRMVSAAVHEREAGEYEREAGDLRRCGLAVAAGQLEYLARQRRDQAIRLRRRPW